MRRPLIILASIVTVGGLYAVYAILQPPTIGISEGDQEVLTPRELSGNKTGRALGPGEGIWASQYDSKMRLTSQFRASDMLPQAGNTVDAIYPEARIPLSGGDVIHLQADRGTVLVKDIPSGANNPLGSSMPGMPTRGTMQNVLVGIHNAQGQRVLAARVNNVAFDLDTFRIYTDAHTDANGAVVPADRVKVEVRGDEMDFDGYGLTLRWDDKNGIVQLLEIAHGERAVIKKAMAGLAPEKDAPTAGASVRIDAPPSPASQVDPSLHRAMFRNVEIASADATAAAVPAQVKSETRQTLYRAKLLDAVTITQGDQPLGNGDVLTIDFLTESKVKKQEPAAAPATPAVPPTAPPPPPPPSPSPPAATAPATTQAAASDPIIVRWTGPLRMVPITEAPLAPMNAGEAVAELSGKAVTLQQAGATVRAGSAQYHTGTGGATLRPAAGESTITINDAAGRTVTTNALDYDGLTKVAVLSGPGKIDVPATTETNDEALRAAWTRRATVTLVGDKRATTLSRIDCEGDVAIDHPRLAMTSQQFGLSFVPGAEADKPTLRQIVATGDVKAIATGDSGRQTIEALTLTLLTKVDAEGQPVPDRVEAAGNVHAYDDAQHLYADALAANLAAAADEPDQIELKDLRASGNVRVMGDDDTVAVGDVLRVDMVDGYAEIDLTGRAGVKVTSPSGNVAGPAISVSTKDGVARVLGAGSIDAIQGEGEAARPVNITWAQDVTLNSAANVVDIVGNVEVRSKSPSGSVETAKGDRVRVTLADRAKAPTTRVATRPSSRPSTRPASQPATRQVAAAATRPRPATTRQSSSPLQGLGGGTNAFGDKEPVRITLLGNAEVQSIETIGDALARQFILQSQEVQYDLKREQLIVPVPGRVLYEDVRPLAPGETADDRGDLAMAWQKSVLIDRLANHATIDGDVLINRQPLTPEGTPLKVSASTIDADLIPEGEQPKADAAVPGVRRVEAKGPITFTSAGRTFEGTRMTYDATTQTVIASGTDREPLRVMDATGALSGTADAVHFNLATGLVEKMPGFITVLRK